MESFVKNIFSIGSGELVKAIVNQYISPSLKKDYENGQNEKEIISFEDKISEYIERSYNKNEYVNTIVFKNQQKKLDDIYIPLTVIKNTGNRESIDERKEGSIIDRYSDDFIPLYNKVLLVDNAGMGKSTVMKYLYLSAIRENKGIPILIELRKFKKGMRILDFVISEVNGIKDDCKKELLIELIDKGDFIFFFDGYDEIIPEDKSEITEEIQKFISDANKNKFIISSRDERELISFGDFQRFDIKPLSKDEAYTLIKKYDNDGEVSNSLIKNLESNENFKILSEFLENPLMVSLLYKSFDYKRVISYEKHIFYRQVYDALYENHDLSKSGGYRHVKKSGLNIDEFHRILRCIGFFTLNKSISYTRNELLEVIDKAKKRNLNLNFEPGDFLNDLIHATSLFMEDGVEFKWVHKSFQEYFAAEYISRDSKELQGKMLVKISSEEKYYNVLDFCYDMDYKSFINFIIYPIIKEYESYYKNSYEFYYNKIMPDIDLKDFLERMEIEFNFGDIFVKKINEKLLINEYEGECDKSIFNDIQRKCAHTIILSRELVISFGKIQYMNLFRLLSSKNNNLIKYSSLYRYIINEDKFINQIKKAIDFNVWVKLNSDVELSSNKRLNFQKINGIIEAVVTMYSSKEVRFRFDFNNCMTLKNEIEKEVLTEENDLDFL